MASVHACKTARLGALSLVALLAACQRGPHARSAMDAEEAGPREPSSERPAESEGNGWTIVGRVELDRGELLSASIEEPARLVTRTADGVIQIYDPRADRPVATLASEDTLAPLSIHTFDGRRCVIAFDGSAGALRAWDLETGEPRLELALDVPSPLRDLAAASAASRVLTASRDSVRVWDRDGALLFELDATSSRLFKPNLDAAGSHVFGPSDQGTEFWSVESGKRVAVLPKSSGQLYYSSFFVSIDPQQHAQTCAVRRAPGEDPLFTAPCTSRAIDSARGRWIMLADSASARRFDSVSGKELAAIEPSTGAQIQSICVAWDDSYWVMAERRGKTTTLRAFDTQRSQELARQDIPGEVRGVTCSPTGAVVIDAREPRAWWPTLGSAPHPEPIYIIQHGQLEALSTQLGTTTRYDRLVGHAHAVALDGAGNIVTAGGPVDRSTGHDQVFVQRWDPTSGALLRTCDVADTFTPPQLRVSDAGVTVFDSLDVALLDPDTCDVEVERHGMVVASADSVAVFGFDPGEAAAIGPSGVEVLPGRMLEGAEPVDLAGSALLVTRERDTDDVEEERIDYYVGELGGGDFETLGDFERAVLVADGAAIVSEWGDVSTDERQLLRVADGQVTARAVVPRPRALTSVAGGARVLVRFADGAWLLDATDLSIVERFDELGLFASTRDGGTIAYTSQMPDHGTLSSSRAIRTGEPTRVWVESDAGRVELTGHRSTVRVVEFFGDTLVTASWTEILLWKLS